MPDETLDLSNVIDVTIVPVLSGLALPAINTAALFSKDDPIDGWDDGQAFKKYTNPTDVGNDFGTTSNAFKLASAFFGQQPNVLTTNGYLVIILLTSSGTEKIEAAIARTINDVYYFGVLADQLLSGGDLANLAEYAQGIDKMVFYASSAHSDFAPGGPLDLIATSSETHTRGLSYTGSAGIDTQRFAAAYAGRALSVDFSGSNTTVTMNLKRLAGITPDTSIDQTALDAAKAAGVDVYVSFASVPGLATSGVNAFFDEVYNEFWFKFALQTAGFNFLAQNGKIPQTDAGIEAIKNVYRQVCDQAIRNGFVAPGAWTSATVFGDPASLIRNVKDVGYYVWAPAVALQSQADRDARLAPTVQIAIKAAGAVHHSNIIVNVNL